jgi:hypothetical protein
MFFEGTAISNYWEFLKDLPSPALIPLGHNLELPNGNTVTSVFDVYGIRNNFTVVGDNVVWDTVVFGLNPSLMENYNEIAMWDDPQKAAVVLPIFTDSAYDSPGFYNYYSGESYALSVKIGNTTAAF